MDIRKLQRAIVDGLEDVKAQHILVFNTEHLSALFERVIVASGTSNRQTKALASSVRETVKGRGMQVLRTEGEENGEWIIVDCGAAVCHVMQPAIREYYRLEEIWGEKAVKMKTAAVRGLVKAESATAARNAKTTKSAKTANPGKTGKAVKVAETTETAKAAKAGKPASTGSSKAPRGTTVVSGSAAGAASRTAAGTKVTGQRLGTGWQGGASAGRASAGRSRPDDTGPVAKTVVVAPPKNAASAVTGSRVVSKAGAKPAAKPRTPAATSTAAPARKAAATQKPARKSPAAKAPARKPSAR